MASDEEIQAMIDRRNDAQSFSGAAEIPRKALAEAAIRTHNPDGSIFVTKDSGERREFGTGSVRDSRAGKGRFDLVPAHPYKRLAQLYERGAVKYGDRNWEKGQPLSSYLDSLERHLNDFKQGDCIEDHLISVVWNAFALIETERRIKAGLLPASLNDLETAPKGGP